MSRVRIVCGEILHVTFGQLTPLYLGEVVAVWAFAGSWLAESVLAWRAVKAGGQAASAR